MSLGEKLRQAIDKLKGAGTIEESVIKEAIKELQRALISSDVEINLVLEVSKTIEEQALKELPPEVNRKEHVIKIVHDELAKVLGGKHHELPEAPERILLLGLFGSGKTTTTGKLAAYHAKRGKKVCVIAADTFRPAAYHQLKQLSEKQRFQFYGEEHEKNAATIVKHALEQVKADIFICDSAGRSALDAELVKEIKEIAEAFNPVETFLVLSADIGQIAKKQALAFEESVPVTGVIITKMDGSAKGGGALAACTVTQSPVYFIGTGEKLEDLEHFDATRYLGRILGYGDLEALLAKVKEAGIEDTNVESLMLGDFNLQMFYDQLIAARKMGPLNKVMDMMGLGQQMPKELMETSEQKLDSYKYIMDSMTNAEKQNPEVLNKSRMQRIAKGSGRKEEDVRELIKQFKQMKKVFKQMKDIGKINPEGKGFDIKSLMGKFQKQKKKKLRLR